MYNPNNTNVYEAALAGALSGMGVFGNQPQITSPSGWDPLSIVAGAWAESFDTVWGTATASTMSIEMIQSMSSDFWASRNPVGVTSDTLPATWTVWCTALIAAITSASTYVSGQGITPTPIPSTPVVQTITTPDNTPNQTIATLPSIPDNATTVIDVQILGKEIGQQEAVSTRFQYTYYRAGSVPQQAGNKTDVVPVTGTLNLGGSTFDLTGGTGNNLIVRASPSVNAPVAFKVVFTLTTVTE